MWRWRISFPVLVGAGLLVAPSAAQDLFQSVPPVQPSKPAPPHPHRPPRPPSANQNAQPDTTAVTPQPPVASTTVTGAIAWDQATGRYGVSWNQPTEQRAAEIALSECGVSGCRVVMHFGSAMCAALATTPGGKEAGAAFRRDRDDARFAALTNCEKRGVAGCALRITDCNR